METHARCSLLMSWDPLDNKGMVVGCDAVEIRGDVCQEENGICGLHSIGIKDGKLVTWLGGVSILICCTVLLQDVIGIRKWGSEAHILVISTALSKACLGFWFLI